MLTLAARVKHVSKTISKLVAHTDHVDDCMKQRASGAAPFEAHMSNEGASELSEESSASNSRSEACCF
ncbi:hypothetical protein Poly51_61840 [Rubripirellula tenax]|uniref:Uncharacterized protein n=1 Tax=Rubripirellula tenax TaxID=2528015 RepID=A0A5C6EBB1_9BACT|nr:hypothetical protein Poly51_61840 [Rubripirellula tenax]